ncbi:MAG: MafI family immunity protein [Candidatus Margulisiibacteriota bacterium]
MIVDFVKLEKDMLSLLDQIGDVFSASERKDVVDFIDHGEYGLALETLSDIFVEGNKNLTRTWLLEIENLADVMGIRKRVVTEALVKQVIG